MRRALDRAFRALAAACALAVGALLAGIVVSIFVRALPALSWELLTRQMAEAGARGGLRYEILGTIILIATALALCLVPAVGVALLATVYLRRPRHRGWLRLWLLTLNGVPSVAFGMLGMIVFMRLLGWGKSWLTGGILLALMILPTLSMALVERLESIPARYLEAAASLGLRRSQVVWSVLLPQGAGGLISGAVLGLARAAGETAPIMFAAAVFSGPTLPTGIRDSPVLALPYHIFVLAQDSLDPAAVPRLWGAALVLLALVAGLSLAALPARLAAHDEASHG